MSAHPLWDVLGLEPTSDAALIRRAYARRLRSVHPEDDPEGFKELRQAYEIALASAAVAPLDAAPPGAAPVESAGPDVPPRVESPPFAAPPSQQERSTAPAAATPDVPPEVAEARSLLGEARNALAAFTVALEDPAIGAAVLRAQFTRLAALRLRLPLDAANDLDDALATLLLRAAPRADALLAHVASEFRWDDADWRADAARVSVLARRDAVAQADRLDAAHSRAWRQLRSRRTGWRARLDTLRAPALAGEIGALLAELDGLHPAVLERADPASVAWWRGYFAKPRLGPAWLLAAGGAALVSLLSGLLRSSDADVLSTVLHALLGAVVIAGIVLALGLAVLFGHHWPRFLLATGGRTQWRSALWVGALGGGAVLPATAYAVPEGAVSSWIVLPLAASVCLAALWSHPFERNASPWSTFGSFLLLLVVVNFPLATWWLALVSNDDAGPAVPNADDVLLAIGAVMLAQVATWRSAHEHWRLWLTRRGQRVYVGALAALAAAMLAWLYAADAGEITAFAAIPASLLVLAGRYPFLEIDERHANLRYYLTGGAWVAGFFLATLASAAGVASTVGLGVGVFATGLVAICALWAYTTRGDG